MAKGIRRNVQNPVPQTLEDAAAAVARIGVLQRAAKAIADMTDAKVTEIRERADAELQPVHRELHETFDGILRFAAAHRDELTRGGTTKSVKLPTGTIRWRDTPAKLEIDNESELLRLLTEGKYDELIRTPKPELDKPAIKKAMQDGLALPGAELTQTEEFHVKPEEGTGELNESKVAKLLKG